MKNETRTNIIRRWHSGESMRRIARELSISRHTVKKVLSRHQANAFEDTGEKKRRSCLDEYEETIKELLGRCPGMTAADVHEELKKLGFTGGCTIVKERVRKLACRISDAPEDMRRHTLAPRQLKLWLFDLITSKRVPDSVYSDLQNIPNLTRILEKARDGSKKERVYALAVLARSRGFSEKTTADCLGISRHTVSRACNTNARDDTDGSSRPHGGRPKGSHGEDRPRNELRPKTKALIEILHHKPNAYGINRSSWTYQSLADVYEKEHGQRMSRTMVREHLKEAGYKWKKSRRVLTSPDPDYREKVELLLRTLQSLKDDEMFFFVDELGPMRVKRYGGRCYVPKRVTPTHPQRQRFKGVITLYGALSATTNQLTWLYGEAKDTAGMIDLVELIFNQYHDKAKIYVTWDAASWHRSNELIEWVDGLNARNSADGTGPAIELIPLPHSAQFLNVIEAVFSGMKRAVIHNSDYQSEEDMKMAVSRHFRDRNEFFKRNPKRAGNKIWEIDFFKDHDNIRSGNYRKW